MPSGTSASSPKLRTPVVGEKLAGAATGLTVATGVILLGGWWSPEVWGLAVVAALSFGDLARRGFAERGSGSGDPTDIALSAAFAVVLFAAATDLRRESGPWSPEGMGIRAMGLCGIGFGVVLRRRAERAMGESFRVRLGTHEGHRLVQTGPFRRIRHPNYAALLAIALGTSAALASPLAGVASLTVWLPLALLRIAREERLLAGAFGSEWTSYRKRTWRLVPGIL